MPSATITRTVSISGLVLRERLTLTEEASAKANLSLPRGQLGTLATRTSSTSGTFVMLEGHTIEAAGSDVLPVDIYDATTGALLVRNAVISAVENNLITLASGDVVAAGIPNTLGAEFVISNQVTASLAIPVTADVTAYALSVNATGAYNASNPVNAVSCVQLIGASSETVFQVMVKPTLETIVDISAGDVLGTLDDIAAYTDIVASNPLHRQTATAVFACLINTGS